MQICDFCQAIASRESINVLELYSGIGGMHYGLLDCGLSSDFNVIAIDINPIANIVYDYNFKNSHTKLLSKNISSINASDFNDIKIDICTMSPPCQPFSRQHSNQESATNDHRTESLDNLITNVIPNLINKPKYFLIENVKNFEESKIAKKILKMFDDMNYKYKQFLLQAYQFGIPNSRLRYYCLAKKGEFCFSNNELISKNYPTIFSETSCPSCINTYFLKDELFLRNCYELNEKKFEMKRIFDYLKEDDLNIDEFRLNEKIIKKYLPAIDIVSKNSKSSNCFTSSYAKYFTGTGSFLSVNELLAKELKEIKFKRTTENASNLLLRKFTPREIANFLSFPENFKIPQQISLKQSYKLLGNSVNVKVISYLLKILLLNESVSN